VAPKETAIALDIAQTVRTIESTVFDVGASLAAARETRGYSLADAERLTNIRAKYLSALERDDFDVLPGRAYARAFLRTYASALGLEADRFVRSFEELVPEPEEEQIALPAPTRRAVLGVRGVVAILVVAGVAAVVAWVELSGQTKTLPPAAVSTPPARASGVLGVHHTHTASKTTQPAAVTQPVVQTLVVRATRGDCWVEVRRGSANGTMLYEGTLRRGGALKFGPVPLWLRLGAPGMVDVTRGGKPVQGLLGVSPMNIAA